MALVLADRVRETTAVVGTGTATLLGAITGFQSFAAVGNANTTYYTITHQSANEWEVGIGTYTASGTLLSRDTVLSSSNGGSLVNFAAGTKDVWVDYPAGRAVYENEAGNVDGFPITGGTINNTVIGGTTPAAGTFTTLGSTGQADLGGIAGQESLRVVSVGTATTPMRVAGTGATAGGFFSPGSIAFACGTTQMSFRSGASATSPSAGPEQMRVSHTASAVNYVQVTGAATGAFPLISAQGSDANIHLGLTSKGNSTSFGIRFYTNNGAQEQFRVQHAVSAVNFATVNGSAAGNALQYYAQGSDTNISQVFQSKGTGAINLAPGSSGVNISNGGTVTAITRTGTGFSYTSFPAVAISAPTTAGGVQATVVVGSMVNTGAAVVSGGTGYTNGDTLTVIGGTNTGLSATLTVTAVSGGVITAATPANFGQYTVLPTNPVSVTGGTGSGATFNLTYGIGSNPAFTITNAGSGYVEQPTVTFSGGGGSGAAAYATVGSNTIVRSLGGTMLFNTPGGTQFAASDSANTSNSYWQAVGGAATADLRTAGAGVASGAISTQSAIPIVLRTNFTEQLRVAHTASAVNYVQVTGAATGGRAIISTQGSDASPALDIVLKGTPTGPGLRIQNQGGAGTCFGVVVSAASVVNYLQVVPSITGFGPSVRAAGSDTNIPLVLQPQGTGALQAQQTDSTATGGNARGANAVDWQTVRSAANQVASGNFSVICGGGSFGSPAGNSAGGTACFTGGGWANVSGTQASAVVGGNNNSATGLNAFIGGGLGNNATGQGFSSVVGGRANTSNGFYNFIGGGFTNSGTTSTAVTTQSATMNGTTAVTLSGTNASIRVGQYITGTSIAADTYVAAISGTSLTLSQAASGSSTSTLSFFTPHGVVVGGGNNQATGSYSFIGGGGDAGTVANRNRASGDWSFVGGGGNNTASGIGSVVVGGGSFGSGFSGNTANGTSAAVVAGYLNQATGFGTFIGGGNSNIANNNFGAIFGGAQGTTRSLVGNHVFPACSSPIASVQGVSQAALLVIGRQTTDATPTGLSSDINAAGALNQVILPNNSAYFFRGEVVSGVTGGGNTKGWTIEGVIKRGANAASTTLVGTPTVTSSFADAGASTWTIAVTADTTNGGLAVTFTGQAGTTIRTVAQIRTTEMTF
jgi:hypothetical protein